MFMSNSTANKNICLTDELSYRGNNRALFNQHSQEPCIINLMQQRCYVTKAKSLTDFGSAGGWYLVFTRISKQCVWQCYFNESMCKNNASLLWVQTNRKLNYVDVFINKSIIMDTILRKRSFKLCWLVDSEGLSRVASDLIHTHNDFNVNVKTPKCLPVECVCGLKNTPPLHLWALVCSFHTCTSIDDVVVLGLVQAAEPPVQRPHHIYYVVGLS